MLFHLRLIYCAFSAFKERPPTPPSRAQEIAWARGSSGDQGSNEPEAKPEEREPIAAPSADEEDTNYTASIKRLMTNMGYVLLLITYGLNVGVFYAISTLLNTVILMHFEVSQELITNCNCNYTE